MHCKIWVSGYDNVSQCPASFQYPSIDKTQTTKRKSSYLLNYQRRNVSKRDYHSEKNAIQWGIWKFLGAFWCHLGMERHWHLNSLTLGKAEGTLPNRSLLAKKLQLLQPFSINNYSFKFITTLVCPRCFMICLSSDTNISYAI